MPRQVSILPIHLSYNLKIINMQKYIITTCLFLVLGVITGQEVPLIINPDMIIYEGVTDDSDLMKKLSEATKIAVNEYASKGSLLPEDGEFITTKSANEFKALFKPTAKLFVDYFEYPGDPVDVFSYKDDVYSFFESEGFQFKIEDAFFNQVQPTPIDDPRYYMSTVTFTKRILNYVNDDREVQEPLTGEERTYTLSMDIEISARDFSKFLILGVKCTAECSETAADAEAYIDFSLGAALPFTAASATSDFTSKYGNSLDFSSKPAFSAGLSVTSTYLSPKSAGVKNLFLTAGIYYRFWQLESTLTDFSIAPFSASASDEFGGTTAYQRIVGPVNGVEEVTMHNLEIPIGVSYRLIDNYRSSIHLAATLRPSITLTKTKAFTGNGTYDGSVAEANFRFLELNAANLTDRDIAPYEVGDYNIENSPPLETGLGLWLQLSPTYYGEITNDDPSVGFQLSLDLGFNILSAIASNPVSGTGEDQLFAYPDVMPSTLVNGYFDAVKLHYIGLRFGINLHWVKSVN